MDRQVGDLPYAREQREADLLLLLLLLLLLCTESETPWTGRSETCPTLRQDEFPVPFGPAHGPCISKFMEDCWCFGVGFGYERTDADKNVRAPEKRRSIEDRADSRTCKNVAVGGYDFLKPPWTLDRG